MKKKIKYLFTLLLSIIIIFSSNVSQADVGSFDRYDSGGSSSSSWSSSSSHDYDYDYGSSHSHSSSSGDSIGGFIYFIVIVVVVIICISSKKNKGPRNINSMAKYNSQNATVDDTQGITNKIRQTDPNFSAEKFLSYAQETFIKLQNAWTARDWEAVRLYESEELYEQHKEQLQQFINNHTINVVDRISVTYTALNDYKVDGTKESLTISLKAVMIDYIMDEKTKQVLKGDKTTDRYMSYKLTFTRKAGMKSPEGGDVTHSTTNCPNCGAPTKITSSGRCPYCKSIITTEDHGWVLANLTGHQYFN